MTSGSHRGLYSVDLSQDVGRDCLLSGKPRDSRLGVAGEWLGEDLTRPGEDGVDRLPILKINGTALWLGDFIGVSCKFLRMALMLFSLEMRSVSGVSGRLSGNSGSSSIGSTFGDAGSLGGNGIRSPY